VVHSQLYHGRINDVNTPILTFYFTKADSVAVNASG